MLAERYQKVRVVAGSFIGTGLGPVVILGLTFGLFIAPISQEFGWSQAQISLAYPAQTIAIAIVIPISGIFVDRFGPRPVILISTLLYGSSLFLFQFVEELWQYYAVFAILGAVTFGANSISFITVLTAWFDKTRGTMIGIACSGIGVASVVLPPMVQWLIETAGWRTAYSVLGFIVLVIGFPVYVLTIRYPSSFDHRRRQQQSLAETGDQEPGISFGAALRSGTFWLVLIAFFCLQGAAYTIAGFLSPIVQSNGEGVYFSVLCVSVFGFAVFISRLLTGFLFDHFFAARVCALIYAGTFVGVIALAAGGSSWVAVVASGLIGFAAGAEGDAMGYLLSRYVPRAIFGRVYTFTFGVCMVAVASYPVLVGAFYDANGNYRGILWILAGSVLVAVTCMLLLPRFGAEERVALSVSAEAEPAS